MCPKICSWPYPFGFCRQQPGILVSAIYVKKWIENKQDDPRRGRKKNCLITRRWCAGQSRSQPVFGKQPQSLSQLSWLSNMPVGQHVRVRYTPIPHKWRKIRSSSHSFQHATPTPTSFFSFFPTVCFYFRIGGSMSAENEKEFTHHPSKQIAHVQLTEHLCRLRRV